MRTVSMISIINHGGSPMLAVYYNECDDNGNITKRNAKVPVYYAMGAMLDKVTELETLVKEKLDQQ